MIVWTPQTRLRNVFAKALHHGHVRNAELGPSTPEQIASRLSSGEECIVIVRDKKQRTLWMTDRRLLREDGSAVTELFAFSAVNRVHWMARERPWEVSKRDNFDRLEIDLMSDDAPEFTLDELDQAVYPLLSFFKWLAREETAMFASSDSRL
jgi:hypothetical protein